MAKDKTPVTGAVRFLRAKKINFIPRLYAYEDRGGTRVAARELGVDEHLTVKTLVFVTQDNKPLLMLMHGDREVSTKALAREIGVKTIQPADPQQANRVTGYQVGGISPFGARTELAVYMESSIADLPVIYINGGKRGFLLEMGPADLIKALNPKPVEAAQD